MMIRCINIYCCTTENITQHHLIPKPFRKMFYGRIGRVYLCDECHKRVHKMKTNTELFLYHSSKQKIMELLASDTKFRIQRLFTTSEDYKRHRMVA